MGSMRIASTFSLVSYITFTSRLLSQLTLNRPNVGVCVKNTTEATMQYLIVAIALIGTSLGDVAHLLPEYSTTTEPPPPRPYNFQYRAGRYPGHVDRVHHEVSDGSGTVHGSYSFIDPKQKVRTVEYTADKTGFHASLINYDDTVAQPVDSEAVRLAKERHFQLYHKIADSHAHGPQAVAPRESASVVTARDRHIQLYNKIAEEHAAIGAQREAERLAYEASSVVNVVNPDQIF